MLRTSQICFTHHLSGSEDDLTTPAYTGDDPDIFEGISWLGPYSLLQACLKFAGQLA